MSRTKPPSNKVLTIRLPEAELQHLEAYCLAKGKTRKCCSTIRHLKVPVGLER